MSEEKKDSNWMQNLWRPAMGWMYMIVCLCDMIIFPVLWSLLQASLKQPITQWNPLSLQGAGLFHIAMGAVLGIAAFGRTQEKIAGASANVIPAPTPSFGGTSNGSSATATAGFSSGATTPSISATVPINPAPDWGTHPVPSTPSPFATPLFSSTGKPMPVQPDQPLL